MIKSSRRRKGMKTKKDIVDELHNLGNTESRKSLMRLKKDVLFDKLAVLQAKKSTKKSTKRSAKIVRKSGKKLSVTEMKKLCKSQGLVYDAKTKQCRPSKRGRKSRKVKKVKSKTSTKSANIVNTCENHQYMEPLSFESLKTDVPSQYVISFDLVDSTGKKWKMCYNIVYLRNYLWSNPSNLLPLYRGNFDIAKAKLSTVQIKKAENHWKKLLTSRSTLKKYIEEQDPSWSKCMSWKKCTVRAPPYKFLVLQVSPAQYKGGVFIIPNAGYKKLIRLVGSENKLKKTLYLC